MNLIIKNERDITNIKLGDSYVVDGDPDPEVFFEFLQEIQPKIDQHIEGLLNPELKQKQELSGKYTVKELKAILKEGGIKGYSKLKKAELINLIMDNKLV